LLDGQEGVQKKLEGNSPWATAAATQNINLASLGWKLKIIKH